MNNLIKIIKVIGCEKNSKTNYHRAVCGKAKIADIL